MQNQPKEPYKHQEFPKAKYHATKPHIIVKDAEEEAKLGKGWGDKPVEGNTSHVNPETIAHAKLLAGK